MTKTTIAIVLAACAATACGPKPDEPSTSEDQAAGAAHRPPLGPDGVWDAVQHPNHAVQYAASVEPPVLGDFPDDPSTIDDGALDDENATPQDEAPMAAVDDVDLRNADAILNQGPVGSCTAHAVAGAMNVALDVALSGQSKQLSAQHLWWLQGHRADVVASIQTAEKYWVDTAAAWPNRAGSSPAADLASGAYAAIGGATRITSLQAVVDALRANEPVIVASKLLDSWRANRMPSSGIIDADATASQWAHAYHAYALVGFHIDTQGRFQDWGGGYVIVKNSWGTSWGDQGYAYMPFDYCAKMKARYADGYCSFYRVDSVITKAGQ